jgi:hypothetical protein
MQRLREMHRGEIRGTGATTANARANTGAYTTANPKTVSAANPAAIARANPSTDS